MPSTVAAIPFTKSRALLINVARQNDTCSVEDVELQRVCGNHAASVVIVFQIALRVYCHGSKRHRFGKENFQSEVVQDGRGTACDCHKGGMRSLAQHSFHVQIGRLWTVSGAAEWHGTVAPQHLVQLLL